MDLVDTLEEQDAEYLGDDKYFKDCRDASFLSNALFYTKVIVDSKEAEICIDSCDVTGVCSKCGVLTEGTIDGGDISYSDYLNMNSPESTWMCEECFNKGDD